MFARVSRLKGTPSKLDAAVREFREQTVPMVERMHGKGAYLLIDRNNGNTMAITLWETAKDMDASAAEGNRLRARAAQTSSASEPPVVEIYEVAVQPEKVASK